MKLPSIGVNIRAMATSIRERMERRNQTTVFIAGAGHSGSTLLGLLLGSHPRAFYAGEAAKTRFLGDEKKPERKRVCKLCGPDCPVWGGFVPEPEPDIYEQMAQRTGAPIIIDSSKNLEWLARQFASVRAHGGTPALVFLCRDGRAVINSRVRKYPDRDPKTMIRAWVERMAATRDLYESFDGPKAQVQYERLATAPAATLKWVCERIGIGYQASMLRFQQHEHHVLGGNNGTQWQVARKRARTHMKLSPRTAPYYSDHPDGIVLDMRWVDELPSDVLHLFERLAGTENASLAWPQSEAS